MLDLFIPSEPLSSNESWTIVKNKRTGRPFLACTSKAKKFIKQGVTHLVSNYINEISDLKSNISYFALFIAYMSKIQNDGWPKTKNRFKTVDSGNLLKLPEDILKQATDIDDSHNMVVMCRKVLNPYDCGIRIILGRGPDWLDEINALEKGLIVWCGEQQVHRVLCCLKYFSKCKTCRNSKFIARFITRD